MSSHHEHKKYLIYINRTNNPKTNYPKKLSENLENLNSRIPDDFWLRDHEDEKVISETFIPDNLKSIDVRYYNLIRWVTRYFDCIAFWKKEVLEGGQVIHTIEITGFYNDFKLCFHFLTNIINSYNHIKDKKQEDYRATKIQSRSRNTIKTYSTRHARSKAYNYMDRPIRDITHTFHTLFMRRRYDIEKNHKKFTYLFNILDKRIKFDYRKYRKKEIHHTFSRKEKFEANRIIR